MAKYVNRDELLDSLNSIFRQFEQDCAESDAKDIVEEIEIAVRQRVYDCAKYERATEQKNVPYVHLDARLSSDGVKEACKCRSKMCGGRKEIAYMLAHLCRHVLHRINMSVDDFFDWMCIAEILAIEHSSGETIVSVNETMIRQALEAVRKKKPGENPDSDNKGEKDDGGK